MEQLQIWWGWIREAEIYLQIEKHIWYLILIWHFIVKLLMIFFFFLQGYEGIRVVNLLIH